MKNFFKFLLMTVFISGLAQVVSAAGIDFGGNGFNGFAANSAGMQNPNQELRLLDQNRFRRDEYNEFDDMKTVKEKRNKKIEVEQKLKEQAQKQPQRSQGSDVQFYMENGQLKLKSTQ